MESIEAPAIWPGLLSFSPGASIGAFRPEISISRLCASFAAWSSPMSDPVAQRSLSMRDMGQKTDQRADIAAEWVSCEGFVILFRTWGDRRMARVRADWLAIGEGRGEDDRDAT